MIIIYINFFQHRIDSRHIRLKKLFEKTDADGNGTLDAEELQTLIAKTFKKSSSLSFDKEKLLEFSKKLVKIHAKESSEKGITFQEFEILYAQILKDPEV